MNFRTFLLAAALCLTSCAPVAVVEEDQSHSRSWYFETDGNGGIYFDDAFIKQKACAGVENCIIQGTVEPLVFFIINYPKGLGEKADGNVFRFVRTFAAQSVFDDNPVPQKGFFSKSHARKDHIEAHEQKLAAELAAEGVSQEEHRIATDYARQVGPLLITYGITQSTAAVSINFKCWSYSGGAHDNWTYRAISIDKDTGEKIELEDLFSGDPQLAKLKNWLDTDHEAGYCWYRLSHEESRVMKRTNIALPDAKAMLAGARGLEMDRFVITPDGLDIVFAPYEQESFAMGDVRVSIPLDRLGEFGVNQRYWRSSAKGLQKPQPD